MNQLINYLMTKMFVEQPLAFPGSANDKGICRTAPATPGLLIT